MLAGIAVPVAPDPERVAAALVRAGHLHVALLHAAGDSTAPHGRFSFVAADPIDRSSALDPHGDSPSATPADGDLARAPRWIGVIPYESRRALERDGWRPPDTRPPALLDTPEWYRYPAVATFDHREGRVLVIGDDPRAAHRLAEIVRSASAASPLGATPSGAAPAGADPLIDDDLRIEVLDDEDPARHAERIAAARELILAGDLYQVNLARRLRVALTRGAPFTLYRRLAAAARAPFSAYLELADDVRVLATSPELLLSAEPAPSPPGAPARFARLTTEPIKGTRPRGPHAAADASHARALDADPKERAELAMIVDVERNDLGRVARIGSVRLTAPPHVVTHRTIHHRVARLTALADPSFSRDAILQAILPSGSVTGAPKVRAMEVISTLEPRRRGLYTGAFGLLRHDGALHLAMAIRTLVLRGPDGEYWTGGGIVADSDPDREVEETRWKALQVMRVAG